MLFPSRTTTELPMYRRSVLLALLSLIGVACSTSSEPALPSSRLPSPTGPHAIGTTVLHLTDSTRVDPILAASGRYRELTVQVWYPATAAGSDARAPYIPDSGLVDAMLETQYWDQSDADIERWRTIRTHAYLDAPVATNGSRWPLLVFSHGLGVARAHYTALIQDLASHGYVVAAVEHPYGGFMAAPDGRILTPAQDSVDFDDPAIVANRTGVWSADVTSVLDRMLNGRHEAGRFASVIDTTRIGMLGHSIGGAAALEACLSDARIKACVNFDGAPFGQVEEEGLRRPTLVMGSGPDYSDEDLEALRGALGRLAPERWEVISLKVYQQLTFAEVGEVLAISPNTAASRYRYALKDLRRMLEKNDERR